MKVLVIDIGGTHIKLLATGRKNAVLLPSGPGMTPRKMLAVVTKATNGWDYNAVTIGFPGPVAQNRPLREPFNLGPAGGIQLSESVRLSG